MPGTAHSGLGPPLPISNQEMPLLMPTGRLTEAVPPVHGPSSQVCPVDSKISHHTSSELSCMPSQAGCLEVRSHVFLVTRRFV